MTISLLLTAEIHLTKGRSIWKAFINALVKSTAEMTQPARNDTLCRSVLSFVEEIRKDNVVSVAEAAALTKRVVAIMSALHLSTPAAPKPTPKAAPKAVAARAPLCSKCGAKDHDSSTRHCGQCKSIDHDIRRCPELHPDLDLKRCTTCKKTGHASSTPHCLLCREIGHDRRRCPKFVVLDD